MAALFRVIKQIFSINPSLSESTFKAGTYRNPTNKETDDYVPKKGPADKLSNNYYYTRDVRRNYPQVALYTQTDLANLLTAPQQASLDAPKANEAGEAVTSAESGLTLTEALDKQATIPNNAFFLPPIPRTRYQYKMSENDYEQIPGRHWPTYLVK